MVGFGIVKGPIGKRAYRFQNDSPIREAGGKRWHHLIDVDWDNSFTEFLYKDRSPNTTVLRATEAERTAWNLTSIIESHRSRNLTEIEIARALLLEANYSRYTAAALRIITRLHSKLSNSFSLWAKQSMGVDVLQEVNQIDCSFVHKHKRTMVEFKIAYEGNTKRAIREAVAQILEYNYYPGRQMSDDWWPILDREPSKDDVQYIAMLRNGLRVPLRIGWASGEDFVLS